MSGRIRVRSHTAWRTVALDDYLTPSMEEEAHLTANRWIKELRHANVDGDPFRRRFGIRGDSLWWFTELYLHKQQVITGIHRTLAALEAVNAAESPRQIEVESSGALNTVVSAFAQSQGIECGGLAARPESMRALARLDARSTALAIAAFASRFRPGKSSARTPVDVAAFVHRAFWRSSAASGEAEAYIGPVLAELALRSSRIRYVGVGPRENFRARRWWHAAARRESERDATIPIERFAPARSMRVARQVWWARHRYRRLLWASRDVRGHSVIRGCDCWPLIRRELAGVALLQWPWSARAMDEAAAALDTLQPGVAITYAEAGGWGRALMLEARRRRIPTVGLQHGFIYRHWLNYLHEPDEMMPDPGNGRDAGFPRPTRTLLFDDYAARHLVQAGGFPTDTLAVTGSPRLDALASQATALRPEALQHARRMAGAEDSQALVTVFTKWREASHLLPALVAAVAARPDIHLVIKTHPAEISEAYSAILGGATNVRILGANAPLAPLIRVSRAIVTVNSTVALDAAVMQVPTLVLGRSGNLQPFVDDGLLVGAPSAEALPETLTRILYDEEFRRQLAGRQRALLANYGMRADGRAAARAADAILDLVESDAAGHSKET
jgi:hypothetical protein